MRYGKARTHFGVHTVYCDSGSSSHRSREGSDNVKVKLVEIYLGVMDICSYTVASNKILFSETPRKGRRIEFFRGNFSVSCIFQPMREIGTRFVTGTRFYGKRKPVPCGIFSLDQRNYIAGHKSVYSF